MFSIIQDFQFAFMALSLFATGSSAFSSTNAGLISVSSIPTTRRETYHPLYMSSAAAMLPEGLVKTVVEGGSSNAPLIARGDVVTVKYTCYSTTGDDSDNILLARSDSQKMVRKISCDFDFCLSLITLLKFWFLTLRCNITRHLTSSSSSFNYFCYDHVHGILGFLYIILKSTGCW